MRLPYTLKMIFKHHYIRNQYLVDLNRLSLVKSKHFVVILHVLTVYKDPYIKVLEYIDQSVSVDERGDLLIFMSGIQEVQVA